METAAYALILLGALLARQVSVGRAKNIPGDTKDFVVDVLSGDFTAASAVATRRGTPDAPVVAAGEGAGASSGASAPPGASSGSSAGGRLTAQMHALGGAAKGYHFGATGENGLYDCSGIVWRAVQKMGIYSGPRFTTQTFASAMGGKVQEVSTPAYGDVVVWTGHGTEHMGVYVGDNTVYAARSTKSGIGTQPLNSFGMLNPPKYYRLVDTLDVRYR